MFAAAGLVGLVLAIGLIGFMTYRYSQANSRTADNAIAREGGKDNSSSSNSDDVAAPGANEDVAPPPEVDPRPDEVPANGGEPPAEDKVDPLVPEASASDDAGTEDKGSEDKGTADDAPPGLAKPDERGDPRTADPEGKSLLDDLGDFGKLLDDAPFDAAPDPSDDTAALPEELRSKVTPLPRPDPIDVDVAARLSDEIPGIQFTEVSLADFLQFVSEMSTIPITIDPLALTWAKATPATTIAIRQTDTTVKGALDAVLGPVGLDYLVVEGHLIVTYAGAAAAEPGATKYAVDDLASDNKELAALSQRIRLLIEPSSWSAEGGAGEMKTEEQSIVIRHDASVQFRVMTFLETLRVARGLRTRGSYEPALFSLDSRQRRATSALGKTLSLNYVEPTRLVGILGRIGKESDVHLLVDWLAVGEVGWNPHGETTLSVDEAPLGEALVQLLEPMELTYRIINENTLQVTTVTAMTEQLEIEFYPAKDLLSERFDSAAMIDLIHRSLELDEAGTLLLDGPSQCLIVAQPHKQQVAVEQLLDRWRAK